MNILVVEDDSVQRQLLRKILEEVDKNLDIYEAEDKNGALSISKKVNIDLFYIDIHLNHSSGLDFAAELREISQYEYSWIVFITTHKAYIIEAFKKIHCYDYILKPYRKKEVMDLTRKIHNREHEKNESKRKYIILNIQPGVSTKIYITEILFIEVKIKTCIFHTKNGAFKIGGFRLKDALEMINHECIIQCHKSFLVNVNEIKEIIKVGAKTFEIGFETYKEKALLSYNFKDEVFKRFKG